MSAERDVTGMLFSNRHGGQLRAAEGAHFEVTYAPEDAGREVVCRVDGDVLTVNGRLAIRVVLVEDEKEPVG